ncbi:Protein RETICULATA-RELATED 6, chloroplastic [Asimina triloba]
MSFQAQTSCFDLFSPPNPRLRLPLSPPPNPLQKRLAVRCCAPNSHASPTEPRLPSAATRRSLLVAPFLAAGSSYLHSVFAARAEETPLPEPTLPPAAAVEKAAEDDVVSRIYDATVIGEPLAVGKDKKRVWEKLMNARIVYLGEAEQVPVREDKDLELEIVKNLKRRCLEQERTVTVAMEAFPCDLQEQLDKFMDGSRCYKELQEDELLKYVFSISSFYETEYEPKFHGRIDGESLRSYTTHWPSERWQEYEPLLSYCRNNGVQLIACGTPLEVLRTVQARGIRALSKAQRKLYTPPAGSGFIAGFTSISKRSSVDMLYSNQSLSFGPSSYLSAQSRVVEEFTMSQNIMQEMIKAGSSGMLVVITGASHVVYGPRGTGLPARISKKLQKKNQAVILLNPERQDIRREGEVPLADFLWYSAARPCNRNCFDRAEIARVMNAAGRKRDALPKDLQKGLDLGVVSPEILQNFFDLEQYPLVAELTHRFQGFRERLLADPKFLHRLAIEEAISITTTLLAQYERRKERFFEELDYVITDTVRGIVVDFFTVWLPAPTISFISYADDAAVPENSGLLKGLLGSVPDNAFQRNNVGKDWNLAHRLVSVLIGGLKLAGVGFVSSIGAVAASNILFAVRRLLNPSSFVNQRLKRSPILKTAVVYASFLGTSANLRYQVLSYR